MRRLAILAAFSILSIGIVHCVGDDPTGDGGGTDNTVDGGSGDATTSADATPASDSGVSSDASPDAAFVDSCVGFADCPKNVQSSALQLWLRGGIGETCVGNQLMVWQDQSAGGRNATPGTNQNGDAGAPPQCGVEKIGTSPVITFAAPSEPDAGIKTQYFDQTLDVDLGFLAGTSFTIIVVHERAKDAQGTLLTTDFSFSGKGPPSACHTPGSDPEGVFSYGFDFLTGISYAHQCVLGGSSDDSFVASTPQVETMIFSSTTGTQLFENGISVYGEDGGGNSSVELTGLAQGSIGRGTNEYNDSRYQGKIGEIIIYSAALAPADLTKIYAHLTRQWGVTL